jgi:hypothetical protein
MASAVAAPTNSPTPETGWGDVFTGGGTGELPNITHIAAAG